MGKVHLLNGMLEQRVTVAELARRFHTSPQSVNRIVNLGHITKIDTIASAMKALGRHTELKQIVPRPGLVLAIDRG